MFDFLQSLIEMSYHHSLSHFSKTPSIVCLLHSGFTRGILGKYMTQCFDQKISL